MVRVVAVHLPQAEMLLQATPALLQGLALFLRCCRVSRCSCRRPNKIPCFAGSQNRCTILAIRADIHHSTHGFRLDSGSMASFKGFQANPLARLMAATGIMPRHIWWDVVVPWLTWMLVLLLIVVPTHMRLIPLGLWLLPWLSGSRMSRWQWSEDLLRSVAATKSLCVHDGVKHNSPRQRNQPAISALVGTRPCLVALHPHGRYPMNIFPWLASRPDLFGKLVVAQSSIGKFVPTVGFVTMLCRVIEVTRKEICRALAQGQHVALFPGGAREMVLCQPFDEVIPLVKRVGFLRIAYAANGPQPLVIPCFLFGMHDAFFNPLSGLDALLFKWTGANLPLWLPTRSASSITSKAMAFGTPLDPAGYTTQEAFIEAYYTSVQQLFEVHKQRYPEYASRTIRWIEEPCRKPRVGTHIFITVLAFLLVMLSICAYAFSGVFWRTSTLEPFVSLELVLPVHLVASLSWTLTAGYLTVNGYNGRIHKCIGYVAALANIVMSASAYHLSVSGLRNVLIKVITPVADAEPGLLACLAPRLRIANAIWHAWGNMQVAGIVLALLSVAMVAIWHKDKRAHQQYMEGLHVFIGLSFVPRITAWGCRAVFPFLAGDTNFSIAMVLQVWMQVKAIQSSKKKKTLALMNKLLAITSISMLATEYLLQFPLVTGLIAPLVALTVGTLGYVQVGT